MNISTWECSDGKICKRKCTAVENYSNKPHEGTSCQLRLANITIEHNARSACDSVYLENCKACAGDTISVQIGIQSVTSIDRLIDICITTMQKGETSEFVVETCEDIEKLIFTATLLNFDDYPELYELSDEQKVDVALLLKAEGVELFRKDKINDAFHKFSKALKYIILLENNSVKSSNANLRIALESNLAGCHISLKNFEYAVELCTAVLEKDPDNIKALYRRACAFIELNEFDLSKTDLLGALNLEPNNLAVKGKMSLLQDRAKASSAKLAHGLQKMFV